jgi:hypothetical protein
MIIEVYALILSTLEMFIRVSVTQLWEWTTEEKYRNRRKLQYREHTVE